MARYSKTLWDTNTVYNPTNMNHIEQGIYDADLREGGTITGNLTINTGGRSRLFLGSSNNNEYGTLTIYSNNSQHINVEAPSNLLASCNVTLPSKAGTLALTSDLKRYRLTHTSFTWNSGNALFSSNEKLSSIIGNELLLGISGDFTNGSAILGWRVNTQGYIQVMGWIPKVATGIDDSYQFEIFILTKVQ